MKITGYVRKNGEIGIRNYIAVVPSSICAARLCDIIAFNAKQPVVSLHHVVGCCQAGDDLTQTVLSLAGLIRHPNVVAVLLIGLGCETLTVDRLIEECNNLDKRIERLVIQELGGVKRTYDRAIKLIELIKKDIKRERRTKIQLADLIFGLECGGSDSTSGLAANPAVGAFADMIVSMGGRVILSEITEFIGAEHILARRALTDNVVRSILGKVAKVERMMCKYGVDFRGTQPTVGNIKGGISTLEEKSLGCIYKAGKSKITGILEYAQRPSSPGLYIMDTPGQDVESITGMVAGGAHLIIFTTGLGTPVGFPVAPVIKVTGNKYTFKKMSDCIDVDVSGIIDGKLDIKEAGNRIFNTVVRVVNGKKVKSELYDYFEVSIARKGFTF